MNGTVPEGGTMRGRLGWVGLVGGAGVIGFVVGTAVPRAGVGHATAAATAPTAAEGVVLEWLRRMSGDPDDVALAAVEGPFRANRRALPDGGSEPFDAALLVTWRQRGPFGRVATTALIYVRAGRVVALRPGDEIDPAVHQELERLRAGRPLPPPPVPPPMIPLRTEAENQRDHRAMIEAVDEMARRNRADTRRPYQPHCRLGPPGRPRQPLSPTVPPVAP